MADNLFNKYRAAIEVLQRGRDVLVEGLADEILDQGEGLTEGGFLFNEFLETQGTRLHFLTLLLSQLEQSAETLSELQMQVPERKAPPRRRNRPKKIQEQAAKKEPSDET
jgi:hypothetical protein